MNKTFLAFVLTVTLTLYLAYIFFEDGATFQKKAQENRLQLKIAYDQTMTLQIRKFLDGNIDTNELKKERQKLLTLNNQFNPSDSEETDLKNHVDSFLAKYP